MPDQRPGRSLALERACPSLWLQGSSLSSTVNPHSVSPFRLLSPCTLYIVPLQRSEFSKECGAKLTHLQGPPAALRP